MPDTPVMPELPEPLPLSAVRYVPAWPRSVVEEFYRLGVEAGRRERDDDTMDMALCESHKLVLRIGQRYRFYPIGDCATCAAMRAEHDEAYGVAPPAQEDKL